MGATTEESDKGMRAAMRDAEEIARQDKRAPARTMLDVVEKMLQEQVAALVCGGGTDYELHHMNVNEIRARLMATPANAVERIYEAEKRVEKMERALNLIYCGIECTIREQREPLQKVIDEALR